MTIAGLLLAILLVQDPLDSGDALEWARAIDELDLSLNWNEFEARVGGEINARSYFFGHEPPGLTLEGASLRDNDYDFARTPENPEFGGKILMFLDLFYADWLTAFVELRGDRAIASQRGEEYDGRAEQYWIRFSLPDTTLLNLQVGKFAPPVGNFLGRNSSQANPLVTYPLPYDHVTTLISLRDQASNLINRRDIQDRKHWRPVLWEEVYGHGAMLFGSAEGLSVSAAVTNTAPASWPFDWEFHRQDLRDPVGYARVSYAAGPAGRIGASWSRGPYAKHDDPLTPLDADSGDYDQTLAGLDFSYSAGHLDVFAEVFVTRFESPRVDDLELLTYYVEAKFTILPGLFAAGRAGQMRFGRIDDASGASRRWDRDMTRLEAGAGFFFTRNFFLKVTGQYNENLGGHEPSDSLFVTELVLTF